MGATGDVARRIVRRAPWSAHVPLSFPESRTALLFFEDFERDRFFRSDRLIRRGARKLYHAMTLGHSVSGFEVWFRSLCRALESVGWRVIVNDRDAARRNPRHPVGLAGYPHVLDDWDLPNPVVLGPGLFDHPSLAPQLMNDPRMGAYLVTCEWMRRMFSRVYGQACMCWNAGIDLAAWPDLAREPKDLDFVVYDKLRWQRELRERELAQPVMAELRRRGLTTRVVRYGHYDLADYRALLSRARGLIYLTEHETQGFAYQEAMASGVPVLAWDPQLWLDPKRTLWEAEPVPASSVPYFSADCGERFRDFAAFPAALERFLARRSGYRPRHYVATVLSLEESARAWIRAAERARRRGP